MSDIFKLLPLAAKDVGVVGKSKRNQQQNYNFRSIDDVVDACHAAFAKHGLFMTSEVLDAKREERTTARGSVLIYSILRVKFTFYAPDGSHVSSVAEGEGMDSGDKASNKAMSAAMKYALGQTLLIPFSVTDSENDSPAPAPRQAPPKQARKAPPKPPEPIDEDSTLTGKAWGDALDGVKLADATEAQCNDLLEAIRAKRAKARAANDAAWVEHFDTCESNVQAIMEATGWEVTPF